MKKRNNYLKILLFALFFLHLTSVTASVSTSSNGTFYGPSTPDDVWPRPEDNNEAPPPWQEEESSGPSEGELLAEEQRVVDRITETLISALTSVSQRYSSSDFEVRGIIREGRLAEAQLSRNFAAVLNDGRKIVTDALQQVRAFITGEGLTATLSADHQRTRLSDRERQIQSEAVGDPVRLTDGAYVSAIPLPVLRYHGATLDLTLHYDSTRTTVNTLGRGWFFPLDSRIYWGNRAPIEADGLLADTEIMITDSTTIFMNEWRALVKEPNTSPQQLVSKFNDIERRVSSDLTELNRIETELSGLRQRYRRRGLNFSRVASTEAELARQQQKLMDLRSTLVNIIAYARDWQAMHSEAQDTASEIDALNTHIKQMVNLQERTHQKNSAVRRVGDSEYKELTGQDTIVLIDLTGSPRLFNRDPSSDTVDRRAYSAANTPDGKVYHSIVSGSWMRVLPNGTKHLYDADGRLEGVQDRNGKGLHVQHPGSTAGYSGNIITSTGYTLLRFRRDSSQILMQFNEGVEFTIQKENGYLARLNSPRGTFNYTYHEEHGSLTGITGPSGTISKFWEQGPDGWRVYAVEDVQGGKERFGYPAADRRTYHDQDGVLWQYRLVNHRVAEIILPTGGISLHGDTYMQRGTFRRQWHSDAYGNHRRLEDSNGFWEELDLDHFGEILRTVNDRGVAYAVERDQRGNPVRQRDAAETELFFERNNDGTLSRIRTNRGVTYTVGNDHLGRINHLQRDDGHELVSNFDDFGRPRYVIMPNGTSTTYTFDKNQRIYRIEKTFGDKIREQLFHYDDEGNVVEEFLDGVSYRASNWDPMGNPTRHDYADGTWEVFSWTPAGRLLTHRRRSGQELQYFYDDAGSLHRIRESVTGYTREISRDAWGRPIHVVDPDGAVHRFRFDPDGTLEWIQEPDGTEIHHIHRPGGIVETTVMRDGDVVLDRRVEYDNAGRVLRRYRSGELIQEWTYGLRTWHEWAYGVGIRRWELDSIGRPIRRVYPDGSHEEMNWNTADQLTHITDRLGTLHPIDSTTSGHEDIVRNENFDLFNRATSQQVEDATGHVWESQFAYPTFSTQEILRSGLHLQSQKDRSNAVQQLTVANVQQWQVHFNSFNIPEVLISPAGRETRMVWDEYTRITSFLSSTPGALPREYTYDALGHLTEIATGMGRVTITRSPDLRVTQLRHDDEALELVTDALGNVTRERRTRSEGVLIDRTWERDRHGITRRAVDHLSGIEVKRDETPRGSDIFINSKFRVEVDHNAEVISGIRVLGFTESPISIDISESIVTVDESMRLVHYRGSQEHRGDESFRLETILASGFSSVQGQITYVRDSHGRVLGERSLSGAYQTYTYTDTGYLASIGTTPNPRLRQRLREVSARGGIRPEDSNGHLFQETRYLNRDEDGRLPEPDLQWDSAGRVAIIHSGINAGVSLTYDPIFEFVREVHRENESTFILSDHRGSVTTVLHDGFQFQMLETEIALSNVELILRFWKREQYDFTNHPEAAPHTDRFLSFSNRTDRETEYALEILINRRPILSVEEDRFFLFFTDLRGTPQGVAIREHPGITNYVTRDFNRMVDLPNPLAVPFGTPWALMDRLPGTDMYLSRNRTLLGDAELFTTPDPELDGLDFYLYAGGDSINHVDWDGLKIVPPMNTYFQQDPRWRDANLGNSTEHSVGRYGCKMVANARVVASILNRPDYSPLDFNEALKKGGAFNNAMILRNPLAKVMERVTGRSITVTRVDTSTVNMATLGDYLKNSPAEFHIVAEIEVLGAPGSAPNGGRMSYSHFVSVVDFTEAGEPIFSDTSNRNRTSLLEGETLKSLEIFQAPACGTFR